MVTELNKRMISRYSRGELVGVKEPSLLESAVNRPFQTMGGTDLYVDVFTKAAALFESLAKNHVFHNANKRTAFAAFAYFLFINGYLFVVSDEQAVEMTVGFVTNAYAFDDIVQLAKDHSYKKI